MANKKIPTEDLENEEMNSKVEDKEKEELKSQETITEIELAKQEKTTKNMLKNERKVKILIPENPLNKNEVVPVSLNGVTYAIPVGQEFEVPESIYKIWKYSYDETRKANAKMDTLLKKEVKVYE